MEGRKESLEIKTYLSVLFHEVLTGPVCEQAVFCN